MTAPTTLDMVDAAAELRAALAEHDRVCREIGGDLRTGTEGAEAAYRVAVLKAHAASTSFHPERKVKEHEVAAEEAAFPQWATLNALQYELRALKERMHSLRQVLSAFQTAARTEAAS
jgi:hypothetical protein